MAGTDRLAVEIARWTRLVGTSKATDEIWVQVKEGARAVLEGAEAALRDGRRSLALLRLGAARVNLAAAAYVLAQPAGVRREQSAFEAEWKRAGALLRDVIDGPPSAALEGVHPAAVRAVGEAGLLQARAYYEASVEYGRNTMPESGLFYLGAAMAARELADLARSLSSPSPSSIEAPALRSLGPDLDALQAELLAAYRPPASIDRHREFILASSTVKEARELDAAGLRHGALLRYLQAALRVAPLRAASAQVDGAGLDQRVKALDARLSNGRVDHSLGRLLLEMAHDDLASAARAHTDPATAAAIVSDVAPRYLAALEPAPPQPARPEPRVTVTLVRWPYT